MQRIGRFYGRVRSRALTEKKKFLFTTLLPEIKVTNFSEIEDYDNIILEIGFGSGEFISELAINNPNNLYIGSEPFINGISSLLVKIEENHIKNIKIFPDDVRKLFPIIKDTYVNEVYLMFPDPWPKRRHWERRFVNEVNIKEIHRILKYEGKWKIATDHSDYMKYIQKTFNEFNNFFVLHEIYDKKNRPSEMVWPKTRYESKSLSKDIGYLVYIKI